MTKSKDHKVDQQPSKGYFNMVMSKRCFAFALCVIVGIIVGAVIFVVIQMRGHGQDPENPIIQEDEDEDPLLLKQEAKAIDPKQAEMMCQSIINGTEPTLGAYNHPSMFHAVLGVNAISTRVILDEASTDTYQKSSYWLRGDPFTDREAISMIRADACQGKVPVVVFSMRPRKGISISRNIEMWNRYKPKPSFETWTEYDKKLNNYLKHLSHVPAIVILEPDLLMFTFDANNLQFGWLNDKYKDEFYQRAQKVINVMSRSWVYVDAGNAAYLSLRDNMENMAKSLLRLDGLRGFAINTAHFFNASYTNMMARRLHCLTGLHYVVDTSRNGGAFSRQSVAGIEKCFFDPPKMNRGLPPGWSWGTKLIPRQKRWSPPTDPPRPPPTLAPQTHPPRRATPPPPRRATPPPPRPNIVQMPMRANPPNAQRDPEGYNQWINSMRNGAAHSQNGGIFGSLPHHQPYNHQPGGNGNDNNQNTGGYGGNMFNDLSTPSGRVDVRAVTSPPTRSRRVELRGKEEALAIYRTNTMRRGQCLRREAVTVHDANVWIKTPGESDGRLYEFGTYHKCLLGHAVECSEKCRLNMHEEQRKTSNCGCEQTADPDHSSSHGHQNHQNHHNHQNQQNHNPGANFPAEPTPSRSPQRGSQNGLFRGGNANTRSRANSNSNSRTNSNSQSRSNSNSFQPNRSGNQQQQGFGPLPTHSSLADLLRGGQGR